MAARFVVPTPQLFDNNGDPLAGAKLNFYSTGTLDRKDTFSNSGLTVANANPVVADAAGRFGDIFLGSGTYRVVLTDSDDVEIKDWDPVEGAVGTSGAVETKTSSFTVSVDDATKLFLLDASAGNITVTLLDAATAGDGFELAFQRIDNSANTVTIDGNGAEEIDGATTFTLPIQYQSVVIRCDGTADWHRKGGTRVKTADIDNAAVSAAKIGAYNPSHGQCRLALDGSDLKLSPRNGDKLMINGVLQSVPSAGVTLAATGLSADTTYYIYAFMNSGTMTLEASETGHSAHTDGVEIKTGDATRSLVGMARVVTGPAWVDSATQRFVRSWFNRQAVAGSSGFTAVRSTTSGTYVELNSEIRVSFLIWSGEVAIVNAAGSISNGTVGNNVYSSIGFDGTTMDDVFCAMGSQSGVTTGEAGMMALGKAKRGLSEGHHFATLLGLVNGGTGYWLGAGSGNRTTLYVGIS